MSDHGSADRHQGTVPTAGAVFRGESNLIHTEEVTGSRRASTLRTVPAGSTAWSWDSGTTTSSVSGIAAASRLQAATMTGAADLRGGLLSAR
jgi:hypothetical protein